EVLTKIPYYVEQAGYCIALHEKASCPACTDTGCPRLDEAADVLAVFREQRRTRYGIKQNP
ncbi:hypothetical protein, partial [Micromonospora thermarum]|uniref:hypothetical protein n=1 Tax=Micromonospora thermarum TaxID=2720024 RepID=UPI00197B3570